MGFVDLHSHVLPALDDGAPDEATSLAMLRGLHALGFERIYATPHQRAGLFLPSAAAIAAAHATALAPAATVPVVLGLAAENMWDEVFRERLAAAPAAAAIPSYDGGPAFLLELPVGDTLPAALEQTLFDLGVAGRLPVLAHPERYPRLADLDRAAALFRVAAFAVDLGALAGYHGKDPGKRARRLCEEGLVHAVASDVHSTADVRAAAEGIAWIRKRLGEAAVSRLLADGPRAIVLGELPGVKLAINLALSLAMLVLFTWLVWPAPAEREGIRQAFSRLELGGFLPYLLGYLALLIATHFARAWRWNNLLAPIGVRLPPGRLLAVSSVGFMAIMALPARLGEFVRPALIRKRGQVSASAALGTVAVERIVDGLVVSLFVFGALFAKRGPGAPGWMMPTAWAALLIFAAAMLFLALALRWPGPTVRWSVAMTLAPRLAPRLAAALSAKLHDLISGFRVLRDRQNFAVFVAWTLLYWITNGLSLWLLARGFGLGLDPIGAFAVTGLVAVGITLPNSPGLVGQYQHFVMLGLSLYVALGDPEVKGRCLAFAIALHGLQVVWYLTAGALALLSRHVSFAEVVASRRLADDPPDAR